MNIKKTYQTHFAVFALLLFSAFGLQAQRLNVQIVNGQTGKPLSNVLVLSQDQELLGESNGQGKVSFQANPNEQIIFRLYGFEILEQSVTQLRDASFTVKLYPAIEELESIDLVTKKKYVENTYGQFELWPGGVVAISKDKRRIVVMDENLKPLYQLKTPKYKDDKMVELFRDANNRLYLLGDQHVIQLYVDKTSLFHFSAQSKEAFNKYIKNLKLVTPSGANIYRDLSRVRHSMPATLRKEYTFFNTNISYPKYHNCGTDFIAYQAGKEPKIIYSALDTGAFYAADREFFKFVGLYIAAEGSPIDRGWGMQQHSYNTIFSRFKVMPIFNYKEKVVVFNIFNNTLDHLSKSFETDTTIAFDFNNTTRKIVALQDQGNERIYLYERQKFGRDVLIELVDAKYKSTTHFYVGAFTRNVRIQNDWIYHLNKDYRIERQVIFENESSILSSQP